MSMVLLRRLHARMVAGAVGWAKALARHFPDSKDSRAPCPRCHNSQLRKTAWARRTIDTVVSKGTANAHSPSKTGVRRPYGPPYEKSPASPPGPHEFRR